FLFALFLWWSPHHRFSLFLVGSKFEVVCCEVVGGDGEWIWWCGGFVVAHGGSGGGGCSAVGMVCENRCEVWVRCWWWSGFGIAGGSCSSLWCSVPLLGGDCDGFEIDVAGGSCSSLWCSVLGGECDGSG
ncbi:hypothetical protein A2U01_0058428, partial [Trifolium medium]|nr:hypothetical protein [Trifolium medium]